MATDQASTKIYSRCQTCANDTTKKGIRFGVLEFNGKKFRICSECVNYLWNARNWVDGTKLTMRKWWAPWTW